MKTDLRISSSSKAILAGLLTGVIAAVINLIYSIVYRETTSFAAAKIIMPFTIFIGFPILMTMAGYAYFLFQKHLKSGQTWFTFLSLVLLIGLIVITIIDTDRYPGTLLSGVRGLCLGMEVITFLLAIFFIPFFVRHPGIYE